jgi:hypothetical protein
MKKLTYLLSVSAVLSASGLFGVTWIGPVDVFNTQYAQNPLVGVDATGNAVILINASDDLTNYYEQGAQFVQGVAQTLHQYLPATLDVSFGDSAHAIAVNASGNAAFLWTEFDTGTSKSLVRGAILTSGTWGAASTLSDPVADDQSFDIGITIDSSTRSIGAWTTSDLSTFFHVQASRYVPSTWGPSQNLLTSASIFSGVSVSGSPSGQAVVGSAFNTSPTIILGSYFDGTSWNTQQVSTDAQFTCNVSTATSMNQFNQAIFLWQNLLGGLSSSSFSNGVFSSGQTVYTLGDTESIGDFAIALDDSANAIAIWTLNNGSNEYKLMVNRYSAGSWGTPIILDSTAPGSSLSFPNIGVDSQGNGYAVWGKTAGSDSSVHFSEYLQASNSWSGSPTLLSTFGTSSTSPNLSMNAFGGATVVWSIGDSGDQTIQAVYVGNQSPNSPTNLTGTQVKNKFISQTDLVNQLTWTASSSESVSSYTIKRDGVKIANVSSTAYQDHNRKKGESYTYLVTAVNTSGLESPPAILVFP